MPDLPIVIPDTAVAPKDYTLSGTQELALKTVRALIDGSGAASAFLPTLQLLDPNGHVMWEGATSEVVAAGASADVSWFPGLGGVGSSSGAAWFFATRVTNQGIAPANQNRIAWTKVRTSDPTVFSVTTHTLANDQVNGLKPGVYIAMGQLNWASPQSYPHYCQIVTDFFAVSPLLQSPVSDSATAQTEAGPRERLVGDSMIAVTQSVPGEISLEAGNADGVAHNVVQAVYAIAYLPNATLVT
jgi:hypothetical protein